MFAPKTSTDLHLKAGNSGHFHGLAHSVLETSHQIKPVGLTCKFARTCTSVCGRVRAPHNSDAVRHLGARASGGGLSLWGSSSQVTDWGARAGRSCQITPPGHVLVWVHQKKEASKHKRRKHWWQHGARPLERHSCSLRLEMLCSRASCCFPLFLFLTSRVTRGSRGVATLPPFNMFGDTLSFDRGCRILVVITFWRCHLMSTRRIALSRPWVVFHWLLFVLHLFFLRRATPSRSWFLVELEVSWMKLSLCANSRL